MKLTDQQIANRISTSPNFRDLRRKIHRMRRLVAGDISALDDASSDAIEKNMSRYYLADDEYYDLLVREVEEGRDNVLLQSVRTLLFQVTLTYPDVEFEDLDVDLAAINSLYIKNRLQPSMPQVKVERATCNYLVDGLGAVFCGMRQGAPVIEHVDPLDLTWDLTSETLDEIGWVSRVIRLPLWKWLEHFPKNKVLQEHVSDETIDSPFSVACYHDRTGLNTGNEAWYIIGNRNGRVTEDDLIERTNNLYTEYVGGIERTAVPVVFMNYLELPSVKVSISPVEMMLAAQIGLWSADRNIRDTIDVGAGMREYETGSYDVDALQDWMDGDRGTLLERKANKPPINQLEALEVAQTVVAYRQQMEQTLISQSGIDPYLSGNKVDNVEFAAQVQAIKGSAGLVAGAVAKDVAGFWRKALGRSLCNGYNHDDEPITLRMRDGKDMLELEFGPDNPIKDYLKPGADLVISEDAITYRPRDQKAQAALLDVEMGLKLATAGYTAYLDKALENYLRAKGEKNVSDWLEKAPMMVPGAPTMGDPAAEAQASTAA